MASSRLIWIGAFVGGTLGGPLPGLWRESMFSMSGFVFSTIGGLVGIWPGWKIGR